MGGCSCCVFVCLQSWSNGVAALKGSVEPAGAVLHHCPAEQESSPWSSALRLSWLCLCLLPGCSSGSWLLPLWHLCLLMARANVCISPPLLQFVIPCINSIHQGSVESCAKAAVAQCHLKCPGTELMLMEPPESQRALASCLYLIFSVVAAKVDEERGQDRGEQGAACWDCSDNDISACSWGLGVLGHSAELGLLISPPQSGKHKCSAFLLSAWRGEYSSCASATPESV